MSAGGISLEGKRGEGRKPRTDFLFEVSWEVCNKVGGINTVIKSKIPQTVAAYGERYCLVGPYFHNKVKGEFEELVIPDEYREGAEALKEMGVVPHYGRWLTEGSPQTLLLDFQPFFEKKDGVKRELWEKYGIDSLDCPIEFDEPAVWGWAAGIIIESFSCRYKSDWKFTAVFHEWLSGAGVLYLKSRECRIGTVFITHATVMGRSLASAGLDLYQKDDDGRLLIESMDFEKEAYDRNIHSKHQLERASANTADVFATVSEITGMEAEHVLGRKPDLLVPNGLNLDNFPTIDENSIKHKIFRDKIYHFLLYFFFPYYHIDIDNTLIYFIASRYEMRDKGIDVFIRALSRLNSRLKEEDSEKSIVAFFWVPAGVRGVKQELVENRTMFKDVEDSLKDSSEHVMWRLLSTFVGDKPITKETIFDKAFLADIKKKVIRFKREETEPPVCTHDLADHNDEITAMLAEEGLQNAKEDKVKIIFYPIYLTGADGLLDMTYYEAIQGAHLGVFPSSYEPWGYTPLEAGALGVASITTDLAGFGKYIEAQDGKDHSGIFVLKRMGRSDDDIIEDLYSRLYDYASLPKKKRIENKLEARKLASLADWDRLIENYFRAEDMALKKVFGV